MINNKFLWYVTCLVTLLQAAVISWHYFNPQVEFIGLLNGRYLSQLPNWYSIILMPLLSLGCLLAIRKRLQRCKVKRGKAATYALIGFVFSFNYGATLAGSYYWAMDLYTAALLIGIAVIGVTVKAYRTECMFGFALSLSFVVGALQAILLAVATAVACWILYKARQLPLHFGQDNSYT